MPFLGDAAAIEFRDDDLPLDEAADLPARLTVTDVVVAALRTSPELQAAAARVRVAAAEARRERVLPNPILSVSFRLAEAGASPGLDLGLAQDLFALLTRPGRSEVADARLRAAVEEAVVVALDVAAEAARLAADVRAIDEQFPLVEERAALLRKLRDAADARVRGGDGRPLDVTAVEEEIAAAEFDVAALRADARSARIALARRVGRPSASATWTIEAIDIAKTSLDETSWIAAAVERRPEVRVLSWELAALEAEARLAGLAPREGTSAGFDIEGTKDWTSGPSVSIPLPFLDDGSAARVVVLARMADARHRRADARRRVVEDVRAAWADVEAADASARLARERLLPLAERRRSEAEAVYRAGEGDLTDVLLAARALQDARLRIADARSRALHALIRLHRAAGGAATEPVPAETDSNEGSEHEAR